MLNKQEVVSIIIIAIILSFCISLRKSLENYFYILLGISVIILVNIITKKITADYFEAEIETRMWEIERFGLFHFLNLTKETGISRSHPSKKFKRPLQIGAFLPLITTALTFGYIPWLASLTFKIKPRIERAAKRHGFYSFTEISEYHLAIVATSGIIANIILAVIIALIGFPQIAKISIYYAFFNMLPISNLDGNKIFFGSITLWSFLASVILIALGFALTI